MYGRGVITLFFVLQLILNCITVFTVIDNFSPSTAPLSVFNPLVSDTTTKTQYSFGSETLGTERDQILTILPGTANKVISSSIVLNQWSNAFLQDTEGISVLQYDGFDNSPSLTLSPGISGYGIGLDCTLSNTVNSFLLSIFSDLPAYYQINVYGSSLSETSSRGFVYDPFLGYNVVIIPFNDFIGTASFTNINAIELILNVTPATIKNPVDTSINLFGLFGYQIQGNVYIDCNQDGIFSTSESPIANATVTLFQNNLVINTQSTDNNGNFLFYGLIGDTYIVCVSNTNSSPVIPSNGCLTVSLANGVDANGLLFGYFGVFGSALCSDLLIIDDFTEGVNSIVIIIYSNTILPQTDESFYTSLNGAASINIIGGERDLQYTVELSSIGRVISTGVGFGTWDISGPSGSSGTALMQYDGIDGSSGLNINGLGGIDMTQNSAIGFHFIIGADIQTTITLLVYSPDGTICNHDITVIQGFNLNYAILFSSFSGNCIFTNVGAIEISVDSRDNLDITTSLVSIVSSNLNFNPNCGCKKPLVCSVFGQCLASCPGSTADCDFDGYCETNLDSDTKNCGSCNYQCSSNQNTPTCIEGLCFVSCDPGFFDCNGDNNGLIMPIILIDDFSDGSDIIVIVLSSQLPAPTSDFSIYTSSLGSTFILGGERDLQLTVVSGSVGRVIATAVYNGQWEISSPTGASTQFLIQYDSFDNSMNLNRNGLGPIDLTSNGLGKGFKISGETDIPTTMSIFVYSPSGICSFTFSMVQGSVEQDYFILFSQFSEGCDFTNVGAIELLVDGTPNMDLSIDQVLVYLDGNLNSVNDGCETDLTSISNCMACGNVCQSTFSCLDAICDASSGCGFTDQICDDNNICTVDTCDESLGCIFTYACSRIDRLNIDTFNEGDNINIIVSPPFPNTQSAYYTSPSGEYDTGLLGGERDCNVIVKSGNSNDIIISAFNSGVWQLSSNSKTGSVQVELQYDGIDRSMNNNFGLSNDLTMNGISDAFHLVISSRGSSSIIMTVYSGENEKCTTTLSVKSSQIDYYLFYSEFIGNCNFQTAISIEMTVSLNGVGEIELNSFATSSTCGNGICEVSEKENCYDCDLDYSLQYLIDDFKSSSQISMKCNSDSNLPLSSNSFVSSPEILGGERDQSLSVTSIPNNNEDSSFSIAINNGEWNLLIQSGSICSTTLQYDGFDENISVQTTGLHGKNLRLIGNSFMITIEEFSPTIICTITIKCYGGNGKQRSTSFFSASLSRVISESGNFVFPYDEFYPYEIDFQNINAVEIIILIDDSGNNNINEVSQILLKSFGIAGNPNNVYITSYDLQLLEPTLDIPFINVSPTPTPVPSLTVPYFGSYNNQNSLENPSENITINSQLIISQTSTIGNIGIVDVGYVVVNDNTFTTSYDNSFIIFRLTDQELIDNSDTKDASIKSAVVDITLKGSTSISNDLEVCLNVDESKVTKSKACLGYIDENATPPEWKCEDYCLQSTDGNYCGKTSHLTSFAILYEGLAGRDGYNRCDFILGSSENDLILSASVAGFVICFAIIFLIVFCFTPLKRFAYGKEGYRILTLRQQSVTDILQEGTVTI